MTDKILLYDVKWTSVTAGPSPDDNKRTELFLAGCNKAYFGNPCKGCFNPKIWDPSSHAHALTPQEVLEGVKKFAPNHYITIVGGEPIDQIVPLAETCRLLKEAGYHIILFTHYTLEDLLLPDDEEIPSEDNVVVKLLHNIDVLIDGEYDETQRIYDESTEDGLHDAVGSANQVIWDFKDWREKSECGTVEYNIIGMKAGDLAGLTLVQNDDLAYWTKEEDTEFEKLSVMKYQAC